jgi:hypothetical protein
MMGPNKIEGNDFSCFPEEFKNWWVFQIKAHGFLLLKEFGVRISSLIAEGKRAFKKVGIVTCNDDENGKRLTNAVRKLGLYKYGLRIKLIKIYVNVRN